MIREFPETKKTTDAETFLAQKLQPGKMIGKQRLPILQEYFSARGANAKLALKLNSLFAKFDRIKSPSDFALALTFGEWMQANIPDSYLNGKDLVYLADQKKPISYVTENLKVNFHYWSDFLGLGIFGIAKTGESMEPDIWKAEMPLEGYYLAIKGGSGSGTFSLDLSIGYNEKSHPSNSLSGQIWRVGIDVEVDSGEFAMRIIRTGTGQKSQGIPVKLEEIENIRKRFLEHYKVSPQRLLLFLALEMAYGFKFDTVKGLSTQGAMDLSLLSRSKNPPDYTASMTGVGLKYEHGNWHKISNLQRDFYDLLAGNGYEDALRPHEVRGYDAILKAFHELKNQSGDTIPVQILREEPDDLAKAWDAYRRLHHQKRERRNGSPK